ncbi:hypothetical protein [Photobacterium nomapromontoriensis]|uniref:hypothetical protein n=1 Tax=Photobacterium nomapromontoriensis TaxID=2910237 RepID=UPI003D120779
MLNSINEMKFVFLALMLAIFTQTLTTGTPLFSMWDSFIAMSLVVFLSLIAKHYIPSPLPTFAYATIIGIVICLPDTAVRAFFLDSIGKVGFLSCCVPLLAFAGLSVGGKMEELKKLSWKIVVLFLVVSTSCFFGASIVAQIGFSMKGII